MSEHILEKIADKKRAIVKVEEKLTVLKRSLEAKQFAVATMQAKQDGQWSALKRMEKISEEAVRREAQIDVLREKMRQMMVDDEVPRGVRPGDHVWANQTPEYLKLQEEFNMLVKINADAVVDVNRLFYGKDLS